MVRLLQARVDWYDNFDNSPQIKVLVDELPKRHVYKKIPKPGGALYYSDTGGIVRFYSYTEGDQKGYGGAVFELELEDGTVDKIKGPWSSRAGAMNRYFPLCLNATMTDDPEVMRRGHTFYAGAISFDLAKQAASKGGFWLAVFAEERDDSKWTGDLTIHPVMRRSLPKGLVDRTSSIEVKWRYIWPQHAVILGDGKQDILRPFGYDPELVVEGQS